MPDKGKQILTIPNLLSVFRILLIPLIVWLYCGKQDYLLAAWVLLLSGATDIADGFIARRFHMVSDLGKVLDPIADKLTQCAMLICLLTRFPLMACPLAALVVKETMDGLMGLMVVKKTGIVCGAEWHGKAATCLLFAVMVIHVLWYELSPQLSFALILLATAIQLFSLVLYLRRNLSLIRRGKTA